MRIKLLPAFAVVFALWCGASVSAADLSATGTSIPVAGRDFFWEPPLLFSETRATFPQAASGGGIAVVAWQEAERSFSGGRLRIHLAVRKKGEWVTKRSVGGTYSYGTNEPSMFALTVDDNGRIFISVGVTVRRSEIIVSDDGGETFNRYSIETPNSETGAPKIVSVGHRNNNQYLLFMTRRTGAGSSLYYSRSVNGYQWSDWESFVSETELSPKYLPTVVSFGNTICIVFQSFISPGDASSTLQLFIKTSGDGGLTWTAARRLTDFQDPISLTDPDFFNNERPHLSIQNGLPFLVWERRYGNSSASVYGAALDAGGAIAGEPFRISSGNAECQNPIAIDVEGETVVIWFDNRDSGGRANAQNRVYLAQRTAGGLWTNHALSSGGNAVLARPVLSGGSLSVFWQSAERLYILSPDISVGSPVLVGDNFTDGKPVSSTTASIRWRGPEDSSGIAGYAYRWGRDPDAVPPEEVMIPGSVTALKEEADEDGAWYFSLRNKDRAGNWSSPETITFIRDTTPPERADILPLQTDRAGYLVSNTFPLAWKRPAAADLEGYVWNLELLSTETGAYREASEDAFLAAVSARYQTAGAYVRDIRTISGRREQASFDNIDDGIWRFSLAPVDLAGNTGPVSVAYFRTNKYIPDTAITLVDYRQDEQGDLSLRIIGRGFARDGMVTRISMGRDEERPERELVWQSGSYTVVSDREITVPLVENLEAGLYSIGVTHPVRGSYTTRPILNIGPSQTIKHGNFSDVWQPSWTLRPPRRIVFNAVMLIPALVLVFSLLIAYYSLHSLAVILKENAMVRMETAAIISGETMFAERKRQAAQIKLRGMSLRIKLVLFTTALVTAVVGMVSAPVYIMMDTTERETLLQGLWERSSVLLEGLASNVRTFLPSHNVLEMGYLPEQSAAIPEAIYVTITGHDGSNGIGSDTFGDYVWATNDPDILSKIDTGTLQPGVSRLTDALTPKIPKLTSELDERARREAGEVAESISNLTQEALSLSLRVDEESQNRLIDLRASIRSLEVRLTEQLNEIGWEIGSEPEYALDISLNSNRRFILFKPVLFRQGSSDIYYRGMVRLEISTESIGQRIVERRISLVRIIAIVAMIAIFVGFIGAFVLATLIILPIRRLVSHIETVRDTEDKSKLEGKDIRITTNDELSVLGDTINDMTHGLVKAALAAADLSIGKEIQKKFIPLDLDSDHNKLTSGFKSLEHVEFFGYYEGAKGVSGDYFDYQSLDGRYFAIIKCDVAGKGIPAALIMIQVATMFINHFKSWKPDEAGMCIEKVAYQINDFIEALGFQGRFAAFSLVLFDAETGEARFCNAGDNVVHWVDAAQRRMRTVTLPPTPATGVLPNYLVETHGGYRVQKMTLNKGDILLLYTDGLEEAKRLFRDEHFAVIECREGGAPRGTPHDTHVVGQDGEEIGAARQTDIINAVMNRGSYKLYKYHNPEGEGTLDFDFAACAGTTEDLVMAMVCAEKMFRIYKNPHAGDEARILVDQKVDAFLKKHFIQYGRYCSRTAPADTPGYLYYLGVQEDEQYDDLTILGVQRK